MGDRQFRFKQFTVNHDRCAMKVGTDGVLLGSWAYVENCRDILDIGCGSGIISLMVAQRNRVANVCGVELDADSARQAAENVRSSIFANRIIVHESDVRDLRGQFDCIVCNPPFFADDTHSPNLGRAMARSFVTLTYEELWQAVAALSSGGAFFNAILPYGQLARFNVLAIGNGFSVFRLCRVHTKETKPPKRVMVTYYKGAAELREDSRLVLQKDDGSRTEEYEKLTEDFYLSAT